ncbi:MAG: AMP-binding protein [bacterium]|nr:AMP-binding protein [bacterium]
MQGNNIIFKLLENAKKNPEKIALIDHKKGTFKKPEYVKITYKQIVDDVIATAANLKKAGFNKGDRIIVFVPMSYSLYVIVLAILYIGAVAVFVDAWADRDRLSKACQVVNPKGFIGALKAHLLRVNPDIRKIPIKLIDTKIASLNNTKTPDLVPEKINPEDEGLVTLTTGTTGLPKGVKRTQGFLWQQYVVLSSHLNQKESDVDLTALPIFVFSNLAVGMTSVLPFFDPAKPTAFDPAMIVKQVKDCGITTTLGSPAFYEKIADYLLSRGETLPFKSLITGGAPVFKPLAKKLMAAFPDSKNEIVYGCTEAEPISGISAEDFINSNPALGLAVGKKVDDIEVKILKPTSDAVSIEKNEKLSTYLAKKNEVGEIIVCGPHVLKEYLGDPDLFKANKIIDKNKVWHRTGDAGLLDSKGNIYIHGRIAKRFLSRGGDLYPIPFEQQLKEIEGVAFAAVIEHNNKIYAAIEPADESIDKEKILSKAKEELAELKPDEFVILKKIPTDPRHNSKVNFEELTCLLS